MPLQWMPTMVILCIIEAKSWYLQKSHVPDLENFSVAMVGNRWKKTGKKPVSCHTGSHKRYTVPHKCHTRSHKRYTVPHKCHTRSHKRYAVPHKCHTRSHKRYTVPHKITQPLTGYSSDYRRQGITSRKLCPMQWLDPPKPAQHTSWECQQREGMFINWDYLFFDDGWFSWYNSWGVCRIMHRPFLGG